MLTPPIAVADFKAKFVREFGYGADAGSVMDLDIQGAIDDGLAFFNPDMWEDDGLAAAAYLQLTAHLLNMNLKQAGGLSSTVTGAGATDTGDAPVQNTAAGGVSVGYALPESVTQNPMWAPFLTSRFGVKYVQMAWPRAKGNAVAVGGWNDTGAPTGE